MSLQIKNLSLTYNQKQKTTAIQDLSLTINQGETCVLIGPSGCGKSSLINILAGNITSYNGDVTLNNAPINHKQSNIGLISQNYGLLPWRNVYNNITLPLKIKGINIKDQQQNINYIMEQLGIQTLAKRYVGRLSGGQKQRVAIASAFALTPLNMLLMDEPFSALDSITREQSQALFLDIWAKQRPLTIIVTHSIDEAIVLGKKIVVLSNAPATIVDIIDNTAFGLDNIRTTSQYAKVNSHIRNLIGYTHTQDTEL